MFEPIVESARALRDMLPTKLKPPRPHFNFITVHYLYMLGMTILCSVLIYPAGLMAYIDALFFAAGSATQSGLNTIDMNSLYLYQQVVMMLIACLCNPVFINTMVVFVRLYWFEKRFEHVVREEKNRVKSFRKERTISRSKSQMKGEHSDSPRAMEEGAAGKRIEILRNTLQPDGMKHATAHDPDKMAIQHLAESVTSTPPEGSSSGSREGNEEKSGSEEIAHGNGKSQKTPVSSQTPNAHFMGMNPKLSREIAFADELEKPLDGHETSDTDERVPEQRDVSQHIAFVERQKQERQGGTGTLRIPGPRDFDQGAMPKELDDSDDDAPTRPETRHKLRNHPSDALVRGRSQDTARSAELNQDDHPIRKGITLDVPEHPGRRHQANDDEVEDTAGASSKLGLNKLITPLRHRRSNSGGMNLGATKSIAKSVSSLTTARTTYTAAEPMPYLSWQATIGRNSAFVGLTQKQREELGGVEYRALKTLAKILIGYFVGFHTLGMMILVPWIMHTATYTTIVLADGINPGWWGVFTSASMFNDLGLTLTPDSMISFQNATLPLLIGSYLVIIGNTGFPCMLRFTIWLLSKMVWRKDDSPLYQELRFLLDHPRRCFTLLFPSKATWWLFWVLVLLNGVDLIFFIILDLDDSTVTALAPGYRVLDGWFQATSTRTAGFSCVNLANLHPAIQVSYMIMMYISVFPIAISVRRTNVYEEKSLGIWGGEEEANGNADPSYVGQHLRRQLSFDLWYIFLGFFIICIVEGGRLQNINEYAFTMFSVLFEIVSAYGTVGLSLGYPGINASFSAELATISKLVIIAMMIRGRHRGLPYALDRAILLPSEGLDKKEAEDATRRHDARRGSIFAEGNEADLKSQGAWENGDLDESGLPKQHTVDQEADPITAGAGGDFRMRRRMSGLSTASGNPGKKHERGRSLGTVISSGLSAGPTFSKREV